MRCRRYWVSVARAPKQKRHDVWIVTLGQWEGNRKGRIVSVFRRVPRSARSTLSASRWSRTRYGIRADPVGKRCWACYSYAFVMDAQCHHPRHQRRKLATDRRLEKPILILPAVQSHRYAYSGGVCRARSKYRRSTTVFACTDAAGEPGIVGATRLGAPNAARTENGRAHTRDHASDQGRRSARPWRQSRTRWR